MQESGEMYLEAILVLSKLNKSVRSVDVCDYLGYSKPSVSRAVSLLKSGGFLSVTDNGSLILTDNGLAIAQKICERHNILTQFILSLGVPENIASADACKIEHVISDDTFLAIKSLLSRL